MSSTLSLDLFRHTLPNGLRVVLHRVPSLPLVSVNLWYHVGSKNERPGRTGFAHLFEHLLFQGSQHVGTNDHFRHVQQAGGIANGSTWYDRTNYYETLPAHHLDLGLWLESDRMGFFLPAISQAKLDTQRDVVLNERRQKMDNQPYGRAFERLHELLYPEGHPYRWPVIGYVEDIEAATLDDVSEFFATYYAPNNAVLTLAGDIDYDHALARVEHYFGPIPAGRAIPPPLLPTRGTDGVRRDELPDQVMLARVYLAFEGPPYGETAWYAGEMLANVLASGKSSLLYWDLVVERQLAQDVGCYLFPTEIGATFSLIATGRPDVSPEILEQALLEHLERVASREVPAEHLERARNRLLTSHFHDLQSLEKRADLLSHCTTFFDDPARLSAEAEVYRTLVERDLAAFAARYCTLDDRAVVTVIPKAPNAEGQR